MSYRLTLASFNRSLQISVAPVVPLVPWVAVPYRYPCLLFGEALLNQLSALQLHFIHVRHMGRFWEVVCHAVSRFDVTRGCFWVSLFLSFCQQVGCDEVYLRDGKAVVPSAPSGTWVGHRIIVPGTPTRE